MPVGGNQGPGHGYRQALSVPTVSNYHPYTRLTGALSLRGINYKGNIREWLHFFERNHKQNIDTPLLLFLNLKMLLSLISLSI